MLFRRSQSVTERKKDAFKSDSIFGKHITHNDKILVFFRRVYHYTKEIVAYFLKKNQVFSLTKSRSLQKNSVCLHLIPVFLYAGALSNKRIAVKIIVLS